MQTGAASTQEHCEGGGLLRLKEDLARLYETHFKTVWNICRTILPRAEDAEDAVQETFVRLALSDKVFRDAAHEKAWLITTARHLCLDQLKRAEARNLPLSDVSEPSVPAYAPDETLAWISSREPRQETCPFQTYPSRRYRRMRRTKRYRRCKPYRSRIRLPFICFIMSNIRPGRSQSFWAGARRPCARIFGGAD